MAFAHAIRAALYNLDFHINTYNYKSCGGGNFTLGMPNVTCITFQEPIL